MTKTINIRRQAVFAGGIAAALIAAVLACSPFYLDGNGTAGNPAGDTAGDTAEVPKPAGIVGEEFTVILRIGGEGSRAAAGPEAGSIQYGGIRNAAQVIAVDAETGGIAYSRQVFRTKQSEDATPFTVENIWAGKKYHFLVLMGHKERDYAAEGGGDDYVWLDDQPPTLLAAGFLGDREVTGGGTVAITMKPVAVDTVFTYEGVTAPAALGGVELPSGVEAHIAWTVTGGFGALLEAQTKAGGGIGWGELALAGKETICRLGAAEETKAASLDGTDHNRIVLGLGAHDAGTSGSAAFRLAYHPLGQSDTPWIIRNGVNDLAQDEDTVFTGDPIPWDGVKNGKGAVAFTSVQGSVDLTGFVPAPSVGGAPQTTFYTSQYIGKVKWIPNHSTFQAGVAYQATITLEPAAGFVFSSDLKASHGGAASAAVTHEYDLSAYIPVPIRNAVLQKQDGIAWVDYSTDKWTVHAYWRDRGDNGSPDDGWWGSGEPGSFTAASYGALIILKADKGYPFDEGIDFKYPTYSPDNVSGPVRGYYVFDYYSGINSNYSGFGKRSCYWRWQDAGNPTSPPAKYDTAPYELYYDTSLTPIPDYKYPVSIRGASKAGDYDITGNLKYKDRDKERFVMVGFNTQDTVPVPVSPPSGGPDGGVRLVKLGFAPLPIPSNVDSGGAAFAEAVTMIRAAQQAGAGYLSLTLDGLTKDGKGRDTADTSVGYVSFSTADSPPSVVVDGGNRVVQGTDVNIPYITVGNGVTLTLRNITLKAVTNSSVVWVESGGVLILEEGAVIRDHTTTHSTGGGGVYVAGSLIMKGGEISGNTATGGNGGGVCVAAGGTFTMQGGAVTGNNVTGDHMNGGGVYVAGPGGTFFMQGGTISGNRAANGDGGGVYVASGGTFVKATGAIYGGGAGNANNNASTQNGHAVYVQGGRYRNDTVMDFLDSGKSINAGGWDYPVITHNWTDRRLEAGQVDWYVFTAPGGGAPSSVAYTGGPLKVSAYRSNAAPIFVNAAAPPTFSIAAGVTVYVKVEGETASPSGDYSIRQGPDLLISDSVPPQSNDGLITAEKAQVDWYFFTARTGGEYRVMWEDTSDQLPDSTRYTGNVQVWAYRYDATWIFGPENDGFKDVTKPGLSIDLTAGETIYVKAEGISNGTYGIRYYP